MIQFRLAYLFLKAFSLLPLAVLYKLAQFISFILEKVSKYRKNIVIDNLNRAFPDKSEEEILSISGKFYKSFANIIVESVKLLNMKEEDLTSRIFFKNPELLSKYFDDGKSVVAIAAHYGNWEWTSGLGKSAKHHTIAIYKPLSNPLFNQFMKDHRAKFGTELVSMRDSIRVLLEYKKKGIPTLSLFIADQSPVWEEIQYWTKFMNQETPVYLGPEKIAARFNMAVVFLKVNPLSKGRYEVEIIPVTEDASKEENFFVTEKHLELLENTIRERPEFWLWSHRRWKLTRKREREEAAGKHRFKGSFKKN